MRAAGGLTVPGIGSNGEPINPQAMSASELYRASFAANGRGGGVAECWATHGTAALPP